MMFKKNINENNRVIVIKIDANYEEFKLCKKEEHWEESKEGDSYSFSAGSSFNEIIGFFNIYKFLSDHQTPNDRFVIVYDVSCPNKENRIKTLLLAINKTKKN